MAYAEGTTVPVDRSRSELYRVLDRYGAHETLLYDQPGSLRVGFVFRGYRIAVPFDMPLPGDYPTTAAYQRELRRRWRVVILVLKGKLESVDEGAESPTVAFMAHLMLPDGTTVADEVGPRIVEAYKTKQMPESLIPSLTMRPKVIALGAGESR